MILPQELTLCFLHCSVEVQIYMRMQISGLYLNVPVLFIYWSRFSSYHTRDVFLFFDVDF